MLSPPSTRPSDAWGRRSSAFVRERHTPIDARSRPARRSARRRISVALAIERRRPTQPSPDTLIVSGKYECPDAATRRSVSRAIEDARRRRRRALEQGPVILPGALGAVARDALKIAPASRVYEVENPAPQIAGSVIA